ncbi:MAG: phosphoribosylamine--glycine ligase [Flavobacteriales bacterium]
MNVLVLGSGGREHAIAWKLAQSSLLSKLFIAPGNPGTAHLGVNLAVATTDFPSIKKIVVEEKIQLVVVGPEQPLVEGIVDFFRSDESLASVHIIGPSQFAAQLEGSKDFAKSFMRRHRIPTAKYATFDHHQIAEGQAFLETMQPPYVLKADGLAAGKGVIILEDLSEAKTQLAQLLNGQFGEASKRVVIEEFLKGIEVSVFAITDGKSYKLLPSAKDYKRIGEGDRGLNTGGMGAVSPVPFVDDALMDRIEKEVVMPTVQGIRSENMDYVGFIFFGLMISDGHPFVIEYNCRMGDPETEVVIPRLKSDLLSLLEGAARGEISEQDVQMDSRSAATIMLVSGGYPEHYEAGKAIQIPSETHDTMFFHAGTKIKDGVLTTSGGRVLAVTSLSNGLQSALNASYREIEKTTFDGMYYRKDIGKDVLN